MAIAWDEPPDQPVSVGPGGDTLQIAPTGSASPATPSAPGRLAWDEPPEPPPAPDLSNMPGYGATDAAARGLTFGLSDVLRAAGGASGNWLKQYLPPPGASPPSGSWSENYQRILKGEQQAAQQYAADYPVRSAAANLVGMLTTAAPGAALRWAAPGARALIGEIARTGAGGALVGTGAAVPQATQEPTWTEAARDVALGAGTGAVGGAAGAAAPSVLRQVVRYPPVVAAKAVPAAIGTAIGEHFFPGAEGLFGAYLGEHTLGSLGQALEPYANKIGTWLQGKVPLDRALGGLPAIPGAALVRWMLPGQSAPPDQPAPPVP